MVCRGLAMSGLGCDSQTAPAPYVAGTYQPKLIRLNFDIFSNTPVASSGTSTSTDNSKLTATINNAVAPKDLSGQKINLVSVPNSGEVYALVNGQKHVFPSLAIFYDYGYTFDMIQPINQAQLDKYPRASLVKVQGSSAVYYLTEGGLVRPIVNPKRFLNSVATGPKTSSLLVAKNLIFIRRTSTSISFHRLTAMSSKSAVPANATSRRWPLPVWVLASIKSLPVSKSELDSYKTSLLR